MPENLEDLAEKFSSLAGQKQFSMPPTEVIENAQRVSNPRIDPSVVSFIMQSAATAQLIKLRKLEESKISIGEQNMPLVVTSVPLQLTLESPWISFSLINDGPGVIFMAINDQSRLASRTPINPTEIVNENMVYPIITDLYLQTTVPGAVANVRIRARQGKWQ